MRRSVQNLEWLAFNDTMIQKTQNVCQELKVQLQPLTALLFFSSSMYFSSIVSADSRKKIIQKAGRYRQDFTFKFKQEIGREM